MELDELLSIAIGVAEALDPAHSESIVHRCPKPSQSEGTFLLRELPKIFVA
jgi:hypothetical protein